MDVSHLRTGRLRSENGIKIIRTQKYKVTTHSDHKLNIAPNLLEQDFSADGTNQEWAGGISYIWTSEGWVYLAVILDLYTHRVIGWAFNNRMKQDLVIWILDMAVALRQPPQDCILHTNRESQFCSNEYQRRLSKLGLQVAMTEKRRISDLRDPNARVTRPIFEIFSCSLKIQTLQSY